MKVIITQTGRVTPTGAKEYLVNDLFKFTIEPEDYQNGEITIDVADQNIVKQNLHIVDHVLTELKKVGLLSNGENERSSFLNSIKNMDRTDRRKAILTYEKQFGGKFEYISNYQN